MDYNSNNRAEALRWFNISERLLATSDLFGAKSFAIRARESDPIVFEAASRVIAVADTLLAGESRINNQPDWYAILQLARPTHSIELIATQYRRLALLLNPERNQVPFADQAFRLISDAWFVLSNPSKKSLYDNELNVYLKIDSSATGWTQKLTQPQPQPQPQSQPQQQPQQQLHEQQLQQRPPDQPQQRPREQPQQRPKEQPRQRPQEQPQQQPQEQSQDGPQHQPQRQQQQQNQPAKRSPKSTDGKAIVEEERPKVNNVSEPTRGTPQHVESTATVRPAESTRPTQSSVPSFWTACPYCYTLYEYPKVFEECALKCQSCFRAFQAVAIPSPPLSENDNYYCCWGFFPLGFSANAKGRSGPLNWAPISSMFACPLQGNGRPTMANAPKKSAPRFYYDDDDVYVEVTDPSESSDEEWGSGKRKKTGKRGLANKNEKKAPSDRAKKGNQGSGKKDNGAGGQNLNADGTAGSGLSNASKAESKQKVAATSSAKKHKGKGATELGKLDLNVEFSNEVEEPAPAISEGNEVENREEDNIEGIGFFEGLDEFLSSLPILNVVAEDKVKAS